MDIKELAEKALSGAVDMKAYSEGMSLLHQSGVLSLLRENGRASAVSPGSPNYLEYQLAVTHWSIGYNTCLDQLMHFSELILAKAVVESTPIMDFGGIDSAVKNGFLTREEADAIRKSDSSTTNSGNSK